MTSHLAGVECSLRGGNTGLSWKEEKGISFRRNSICKFKCTTSMLVTFHFEGRIAGAAYPAGYHSWGCNSKNSRKHSAPPDLMKPGLGGIKHGGGGTHLFMSSLFPGTIFLALNRHHIHCWIWLEWLDNFSTYEDKRVIKRTMHILFAMVKSMVIKSHL